MALKSWPRLTTVEQGERLFRDSGSSAIETDQVGGQRFSSSLTDQGRNLAAMVGSVIYNVLHQLPQRHLKFRTR